MPEHLHIPEARLPRYLQGLRPPATIEDALAYAEEHGAPPEALEFIEALPASVFDSEEGMRHAFSTLHAGDLPHLDLDDVRVGEDGVSS